MIPERIRTVAAVVPAVLLLLFSSCSKPNEPDAVGGGDPTSTSTGNAFTGRMVNAGGLPVAGAAVSLYPVDFQPQAGGAATADTVTDSLGYFRLTKPAGNTYNVFGGKGGSGVLVDSFVISDDTVSQDIADCVMLPNGSISGVSRMKGQVDTNQTKIILFLTGTGRMATVGMDGAFRFPQVPAGTYQFVAVPYYDYYSSKILDVGVVSGQETVLDTLYFEVAPQDTVTTGNTPPVAVFTISQDVGFVTTVFDFDASGSYDTEHAAGDLLVRWDWNDDGWDTDWSAQKTSAHQYAVTGSKTVKLEVLDPQGLTSVISRTVTVANTAPSAAFTVMPDTVREGEIVTVDAADVSDLEDAVRDLEVRWDWESDGTWDTGWQTVKSATHACADGGNITITVQVRDTEDGSATATRAVYVVPDAVPVADFAVSSDTVWTGKVFSVDASGVSDAEDPAESLEVRWDWEDDGIWDTPWRLDKTDTNTYGAAGTYTIRLEVRDGRMQTAQTTRTVLVSGIPSALIGYWTFDEGSGGIAADASGYGDPAVLNGGAAWGGGVDGACLALSGNPSYVSCGSSALYDVTGAFTLSVWFKTSMGASGGLFCKSRAGTDDRAYRLHKTESSDALQFAVGSDDVSGGWAAYLAGDTRVDDGVWHHAVGVFDGPLGRMELYLDGRREGTFVGSVPQAVRTNGLELEIGRTERFYCWDGSIDDARMYSYALDLSDVEALYGAHAATVLSGELEAYWSLDEASGDEAHCAVSAANDGMLVDGAAWSTGICGAGVQLASAGSEIALNLDSGIGSGAPFTVCMWVNPSALPSGNEKMHLFGAHQTTQNRILLSDNGALLIQNSLAGVDGNFYSAAGAVPAGEWTHIAYSSTGTVERVYVNGTLNATRTVPDGGNTTGWSGSVYVGKYIYDATVFYQYFGRIDEIEVFDACLSPGQVQHVFEECAD